MVAKLWDDESDAIFIEAAEDVDQVAGRDWDRDSVRIEKVTSEMFKKFGLSYHGRRQVT